MNTALNSININVKGLEHLEDKETVETVEKAISDSCKEVFDIAYSRGFEAGRRHKADELIEATANVKNLMFKGREDDRQH